MGATPKGKEGKEAEEGKSNNREVDEKKRERPKGKKGEKAKTTEDGNNDWVGGGGRWEHKRTGKWGNGGVWWWEDEGRAENESGVKKRTYTKP